MSCINLKLSKMQLWDFKLQNFTFTRVYHWFNWPNQQWNPRVFAWLYHVTNQLHNQFCEFYCLGNFCLVISYYIPSQTKIKGRVLKPPVRLLICFGGNSVPLLFFTTERKSLKICTYIKHYLKMCTCSSDRTKWFYDSFHML